MVRYALLAVVGAISLVLVGCSVLQFTSNKVDVAYEEYQNEIRPMGVRAFKRAFGVDGNGEIVPNVREAKNVPGNRVGITEIIYANWDDYSDDEKRRLEFAYQELLDLYRKAQKVDRFVQKYGPKSQRTLDLIAELSDKDAGEKISRAVTIGKNLVGIYSSVEGKM